MFTNAFLSLAGLALAAAPAYSRPADDELQLKAGDPAPALSIETWVKGTPVTGFEAGKLYVVEFWATWCGPCIQSMPHLSEVQAHYREKGLTVISVTRTDERNTPEEVTAMVEEKGDTMAYTVAIDQGRETSEAFMEAAGQNGIPCCFVVDGTGTVAYIGHPMWLDLVLERVVAGTWDPATGGEEVEKAEDQLSAVFETAEAEPEKALELWLAFEKAYPGVARQFRNMHFALLLKTGRLEEGYKLGRELVAEAMKGKDANMLLSIAAQIVDPEQELEQRDLDLAFKAAKMANELTKGENPWALMTLARVHSLKGEHETAIALQEQAIGLVENPRMKEFLEGVLEELRAAAGQ